MSDLYVKVSFIVAYEDLDLPENVKSELIKAAEEERSINQESVQYPNAAEWLNRNINDCDSLGHKYEIIDVIEPE